MLGSISRWTLDFKLALAIGGHHPVCSSTLHCKVLGQFGVRTAPIEDSKKWYEDNPMTRHFARKTFLMLPFVKWNQTKQNISAIIYVQTTSVSDQSDNRNFSEASHLSFLSTPSVFCVLCFTAQKNCFRTNSLNNCWKRKVLCSHILEVLKT